MRKLIVSYLQTADGVQDAPRSWAGPHFDEQAAEKSLAQLNRADAMLMGRVTYDYFADAWPQASGPYPDRINAMRKYVFSSTLREPRWHNSVVIAEDPVTAVGQLKRDGDGDLVIYGYSRLARTLLDHDLVDELVVAIHPVLVGEPAPAPRPERAGREPRLVSVEQRRSGVVSLTYSPAR
jgi:dihydrofolate reductase